MPLNKIERKDYARAQPVFANLAEIHLNVTAVLDGNCPGEVYVDDMSNPLTATLISGDGYYLAGATSNHAFNAALNAALPRDHYFVLFCDLERWAGALDSVLKDTYAVRAARRYHTLRQIRIPDWQDRIPGGFSMQQVNAEFLVRDLKNVDSVTDWIFDGWHSVDAFLEQGFGFCLVCGDDIASWSLVDYISGDRCEMGISTAWDYRRQGLGTLAATATAAEASARGFVTIGWHCWDNNVGSIGVAENVGFQEAVDYDVWINHWAAENVTDMTRDEFRVFAEFYELEFQSRPPASGFPYIVAAKARALSGDRQGCFRHLNKAVDLGWLIGADHLREIWPEFFWNPDLDQIEEWSNLVHRFETGA
jgi:RimJ/RimL family protein N-acetyltransferase